MPKPPPRKPLFCPPVVNVARSNEKEVIHKPKPGQIGWQEDMTKRMEKNDDELCQELEGDKSNVMPKPGQKG